MPCHPWQHGRRIRTNVQVIISQFLTLKKHTDSSSIADTDNKAIVINQPGVIAKPIPFSPPEEKLTINPLFDKLVSMGIAKKTAQDLIDTVNHGIIENQIESLPYRKNIADKPAFLIKAIMEDYPLPAKLKKKLAQKQAEKEAELKAKYSQYLIAQVDQYLATLDKKLVELELQEYKQTLMQESGLDEELLDKPGWKDYYETRYKFKKSKTLDLPDFLEWSKTTGR